MTPTILVAPTLTSQVRDLIYAFGLQTPLGAPETDTGVKYTSINQALAGSRTTSVLYTNTGTTPRFIMISMALSAPGANGAHLQVNNVDVAHSDANPNVHFFIMGIAPPAAGYLLTASGGINLEHWTEYNL